MAVLSRLAPLHGRAVWRELRSGSARTLSAAGACAAAIVLLRRVHFDVGPAMTRARAGEYLPLEALLVLVAVGWCPVVAFAGGVPLRGLGLVPARLRTQPLRSRTLLGLSALTLCLQPGCWIAALAALRAAWPLLSLGSPVWGGLAAGLCVVLSACGAWLFAICTALSQATRFGQRVATIAMVALAIGIAVLWGAGVQIQHAPDGWVAVHASHRILLLDGAHRAGWLADLTGASPAGWAVQAAAGSNPGRRCAALAGWLLAAAALTAWGHQLLLRTDPASMQARRKRRRAVALGAVPFLPPRLGMAVGRELQLLFRALDGVWGFAAGGAGALVVALWHGVSMLCVWISLGFVLLSAAGFAFNSFGLDGRGVDRLRLLPLTSREVVAAKNLALALLVALQSVLLVAATGWRFGAVQGMATMCAALNGVIAYALLGNVASLYFPARRDPHGFEGSEQSGGVLGSLVATGVAVLGCVIGIALTRRGVWVLLGVEALILAAAATGYALLLPRMGTHLDARYESLHQRLTAHDA